MSGWICALIFRLGIWILKGGEQLMSEKLKIKLAKNAVLLITAGVMDLDDVSALLRPYVDTILADEPDA